MHIHAHTYPLRYASILTYEHTYMHTHKHMDIYQCSHMHTHNMDMYTCTLTHMDMHTGAHICTSTYIYICISTCIHTFTHRYTYMNIHIYVFLLFKYKLRKPMIQAASPLADLRYGQDSRQRPHQTLLSAHSLSTSKRPWSRMKRRIKRRGWG